MLVTVRWHGWGIEHSWDQFQIHLYSIVLKPFVLQVLLYCLHFVWYPGKLIYMDYIKTFPSLWLPDGLFQRREEKNKTGGFIFFASLRMNEMTASYPPTPQKVVFSKWHSLSGFWYLPSPLPFHDNFTLSGEGK